MIKVRGHRQAELILLQFVALAPSCKNTRNCGYVRTQPVTKNHVFEFRIANLLVSSPEKVRFGFVVVSNRGGPSWNTNNP